MPLIIGTTPNSEWSLLTPLLNHLGWQQQIQDPETWYQSQATRKDPGTTQYLLLHTRPERAIAYALDAGSSPDKALEGWQHAAEQLLAFYKYHRKQATMVEVLGAARYSNILLDWLKTNHAAFYDLADPVQEGLDTSPPVQPSEFNLLIAAQLVAQNAELQPLLAQLEACSIPLADNHYCPPEVDVSSIHQQIHEQKSSSQAELKTLKGQEALKEQNAQLPQRLKETEQQQVASREQKELEEENELILKQLFQVQEELEKYYLDAKAKTEQLTEKEQQFKSIQAKLKTANADLKASEANQKQVKVALHNTESEVGRLDAELSNVQRILSKTQAELERQGQSIRALEKEKHDLGVEKYQLESELALANIELSSVKKKLQFVQQSTSWRLTTPLRKAARLVHKPSRGREFVDQQVALIKQCDLFDAKWYLNNNLDLKEKGIDPAEHFVMYGGKEGRAPGPNFNAKRYLKKYPDVAESGQNPLVHYLLHGKAEGRSA